MAYTIRIPTKQAAFECVTYGSTTLEPITTIDQVSAAVSRMMYAKYSNHDWKAFYKNSKLFGQVYVIELRKIRLKEEDRKSYCGQHAGPCVLSRPRKRDGSERPLPKARYLEAADWIKLHNALNILLDLRYLKAEIFSTRVDMFGAPGCSKSKFLIRSFELGGRKRFDYINGAGPHALRPLYLFDPGQPCQFGEHLPYGEVSELREVDRVVSTDVGGRNLVVVTR